MNGIHDMGGMHGFGSIDRDEARFHDEWERLVFGLTRVVGVHDEWTIDESRHAIEQMDPSTYLAATYFERWLAGLERNLVRTGVCTRTEIEAATQQARDRDDPQTIVPDHDDPALAARVRDVFEQDASFDRPDTTPQFDEGDRVRVRNINPAGHTRCPRYVREKTGTVRDSHGNFVFPDANAHGPERDDPLYTVAFDARTVWGPDAERADDTIHVDLWEPYLRPATADHSTTNDQSAMKNEQRRRNDQGRRNDG